MGILALNLAILKKHFQWQKQIEAQCLRINLSIEKDSDYSRITEMENIKNGSTRALDIFKNRIITRITVLFLGVKISDMRKYFINLISFSL